MKIKPLEIINVSSTQTIAIIEIEEDIKIPTIFGKVKIPFISVATKYDAIIYTGPSIGYKLKVKCINSETYEDAPEHISKKIGNYFLLEGVDQSIINISNKVKNNKNIVNLGDYR